MSRRTFHFTLRPAGSRSARTFEEFLRINDEISLHDVVQSPEFSLTGQMELKVEIKELLSDVVALSHTHLCTKDV